MPYCAASSYVAYYPVTVTLSQVKTSALGSGSAELTLTWRGKPPRGHDAGCLPALTPRTARRRRVRRGCGSCTRRDRTMASERLPSAGAHVLDLKGLQPD